MIIILFLAAALQLSAQTDAAERLEQKTLQKIREFDSRFDGVLGVAALDLSTGRLFSHNGETVFAQASSIKVPILLELILAERRGEIRFSNRVTLTSKDAAGGDGSLQHRLRKGENLTLTSEELIQAMILESDNTATNRLIDMVGMERVNQTLDYLGLRHTRLRRKMMDAAAVERGDENVSTPVDMVRLMELIHQCKIIDAKGCDQMLGLLKQVKDEMRAAVPARYQVASKWGRVPGVACETGIVYLHRRPFALSVMSVFNGARAENPVGPATRIVFDHFDRLANSNRYGHRFAVDHPAPHE